MDDILIFTLIMRHFQLLRLNSKGQLAVGERCLEVIAQKMKVVVCPINPSGPWSYDSVSCILLPIMCGTTLKCRRTNEGLVNNTSSQCGQRIAEIFWNYMVILKQNIKLKLKQYELSLA